MPNAPEEENGADVPQPPAPTDPPSDGPPDGAADPPSEAGSPSKPKRTDAVTVRIQRLLAHVRSNDIPLSAERAVQILAASEPLPPKTVQFVFKAIAGLVSGERLSALWRRLVVPLPPVRNDDRLVLPLRQFSDDLASRRQANPDADGVAAAFAAALFGSLKFPDEGGVVYLGNGTTVYQIAEWMARSDRFKQHGVVTTNFEVAALFYYHQERREPKVRRLFLGSHPVDFDAGCVKAAGPERTPDVAVISFHTYSDGQFWSRDETTAASSNHAIRTAKQLVLVAESVKVGAYKNSGDATRLDLVAGEAPRPFTLVTDDRGAWEAAPGWDRWAPVVTVLVPDRRADGPGRS